MSSNLVDFVRADRQRPLPTTSKGASALDELCPDELARLQLTIADLPTPLLALNTNSLFDNARAMESYCEAAGVEIAPHGKTTMAPELWRLQFQTGAWGITIANEHQVAVALQAGVPRIMLANAVMRPTLARRLSAALTRGSLTVAVTWIDSIESVEVLAAGVDPEGPISVLVEMGVAGGRTGVRTVEEAERVAARAAQVPGLRVLGVAGYEGAVADVRTDPARFHSYLDSLVAAFDAVEPFTSEQPAWLSVGGSFGIAETIRLTRERLGARAPRLMIRAGAYLIHDHGHYASRPESELPLKAAITVWARVLSTPEPGLALIDAGRRDVSFDLGLPIVLGVHRDGARIAAEGARVSAVNDQHGYVDVSGLAEPVRVGDLMELGISHPCTTFDKWPVAVEVTVSGDSTARIIGAVRTYF